MNIMKEKGFSLVELVVVIAIMGTLMTIATLNFNAWQKKTQIERQTREMFADINQARIDSFHRKLRHSIVMQPNSYTFRRYSSENESRSAGTTVQTKNVSYQITKESGSTFTDDITEFDIRGFTNDNDIFRINPADSAAQVDCIVITTGRTNLGKMENESCVIK
jgi:prepilin-type N-terminal cleavage/methylation domain-containing protein